MADIRQELREMDVVLEEDDCVIVGDEMSSGQLLGILCELTTATVILEPQERLNGAIHGYNAKENRLLYDVAKLAKCFDDWWCETAPPEQENPLDRLDECMEWATDNCDVGIILVEIEESWRLWE